MTSPPNNGVARKLASNNGKAATPDATSETLRVADAMASARVQFLRHLSSESEAPPVGSARTTVFVKNNCVKFQLGHDDETNDVITQDVTASI